MCEARYTLTKQDNGRELLLKPGQGFALDLDELSGAGYRWTWKLAPDAPIAASTSTSQPYPGVGAGTQRHLLFCAVHEGKTDLLLELRRSWEKDAAPQDRMEVSVTVRTQD